MAKVAFAVANAKEAHAARKNAAGRAAIARSIAASKKAAQRQLKDAVGTMNRSLLALKTETAKKIKKTNHKVTAYADALAKEAKDVDAASKANAASAAGFRAALGAVKKAMGAAQRRASRKF